ncbi:hypothetical protein [Frigidibacter sp. MR17.24]|uniref:hypothetical protein n=1 Tax=Frigidibacter sp. MR17.24 TaxID=3127345 RepID=UPI0030130F04
MAHDLTFSSPTQIAWACRALLTGRTIGHNDEIAEVDGHRLAAIVHRLKSKYGWPIDTTYTGRENAAQYKLRPGCDRAALRFPPSAKHLGTPGAAE